MAIFFRSTAACRGGSDSEPFPHPATASTVRVNPMSKLRALATTVISPFFPSCLTRTSRKIRNTNIEIRNNDRNKNAPMTKTTDFQCISFGHFVIRYSNLFRVSDFDIRILPEYDFLLRHYLPSGACPTNRNVVATHDASRHVPAFLESFVPLILMFEILTILESLATWSKNIARL